MNKAGCRKPSVILKACVLPSKRLFFAVALGLFGLRGRRSAPILADEALRRVQQALHDQGFYYGPIDGTPGDETTHAINRYQIRNGLAVTGQLNDETIRAINRTGGTHPHQKLAAATVPPAARSPGIAPRTGNRPDADDDRRYAQGDVPAPLSRATPAPVYHPPPPPNRPDPGDADTDDNEAPISRAPANRPDLRAAPSYADPDRDAAPPREGGIPPSATLTSVFERTPYEFAPPPVQADILRRAQSILLRDGFYDGEASGRPNPVTFEALTNFQGVNHLRRTGRLDVQTLAVMRLMPERRPSYAPRGPGPGGVYEGRVVQ